MCHIVAIWMILYSTRALKWPWCAAASLSNKQTNKQILWFYFFGVLFVVVAVVSTLTMSGRLTQLQPVPYHRSASLSAQTSSRAAASTRFLHRFIGVRWVGICVQSLVHAVDVTARNKFQTGAGWGRLWNSQSKKPLQKTEQIIPCPTRVNSPFLLIECCDMYEIIINR